MSGMKLGEQEKKKHILQMPLGSHLDKPCQSLASWHLRSQCHFHFHSEVP